MVTWWWSEEEERRGIIGGISHVASYIVVDTTLMKDVATRQG